jgi:ribosomal protein L37E
MYKSFLGKTEECENCGERLSTKQKYCPNCGAFNPDYRKRNWTAVMGEKLDEQQEDEDLTK